MSAIAWRALALFALGLALIGLALPILPQIPFLLIAAGAAAKGWPALDRRLRSHPVYGPMIVGWCEHGALPTPVKVSATVGLVCALAAAVFVPPLWAKIAVVGVVLGFLLWIWSRPAE